jgi:hypothetical protein
MISVVALLALPCGIATSSGADAHATMSALNDTLSSMGANVRMAVVETYTGWNEAGQTVFFSDRFKQLGAHWVPGDPNRDGRTNITWISDRIDGAASNLSVGETQAAVGRAMATWEKVRCSNPSLIQLDDLGADWGYVQYLLGLGGVPGWLADYTHAGWLPGGFFDALQPGGSAFILGATVTFIWIDTATGNPTDLDNNGKLDVAFRETYYNNAFQWGINTGSPIDVQSVVLHEAGHGLSQGHFGALFRTDANGRFHFAPRAVMNAGYTGVQQRLTGTDNGGHCSIWASWPH